ncbi:hypothetical protein I6F33_36700 [Bradyrhizobium sp. BRP20]|uniref:hypothetical protein n=1 Tax=Bradyrhizobium sp. BRP20 TaxID=2793822 RepID=UPI001CD73BDA|nr:hypothetical protein [Bradyrhizobium sp. BRP20]MCA1438438.1 hypothetical protein [Bradyrhizobium sp. BRP20]
MKQTLSGRGVASPEYKSLLQKAILGGKKSLVYQAGNGLAAVPTQLYQQSQMLTEIIEGCGFVVATR